MGFRDLGLEVWGLGFRVWGLGVRVYPRVNRPSMAFSLARSGLQMRSESETPNTSNAACVFEVSVTPCSTIPEYNFRLPSSDPSKSQNAVNLLGGNLRASRNTFGRVQR